MDPKMLFKTNFGSIEIFLVLFLQPFQEIQKESSLLNLQKWFKEI